MRGIWVAWLLAGFAALPSAATAACSVVRLAELPITMTSGYRPTVAAKINGTEAHFIADSGAAYSLISPGVAGAAGLKATAAPPEFHFGGVGGETSISLATVKDFTLAGLPIHNIQFLVGGTDTGTAGLIGQNILGFADVEYDLPHGAIRLFRSKGCGGRAMAYWSGKDGNFTEIRIRTLEEARRHTVGTVYVNGQAFQAIFDTGATRTALSRKAAERLGFKPDGPGVVEAGYGRGLGRKVTRSWAAPFASFKIGEEELKNVHLHVIDADLGDEDMLLGADFFIAHRVYVDNSAHRLFLTYTGGRIFGENARRDGETQTAAPAVAQEGEPKDAEAFARRGAVFLTERDFSRAVVDFSRAIELAPKEPRFLLQRAEAYGRSGRPFLAAADVNKALDLDPSNVSARMRRAQLRIAKGDREAALADVDAAAKAMVGPVNERMETASLYVALDRPDRAIAQLDAWIAAHPEDASLPAALNERCWARALAGIDLEKAVSDCNGALRRRPKTPAYLDSRGLARLRLGEYDRAIEDFDAALQGNPKLAWSLYGRGLARRHKGQAPAAEADFKAAAELQPGLAERARKLGID
jgi:tetratricopeptide (TPR) repeat protein/predicted aspartyl protease